MQVLKAFATSFILCLTLALTGQTTVDYTGKSLQSLPSSLKSNNELRELILTGTSLTTLPEWITEFPNLEKITLDEVTTLPVSGTFDILSRCPVLKELSWKKGKLIYIPVALSNFDSLNTLNLSGNGIVKLPLMKKDNNIISLDLSNNLIDSLKSPILHFKKLEVFDLSFNPAVNNGNNYHLLENLQELNTLVLGGLKEVSDKLCALKGLKKLNLAYSRIHTLPDNIKQLTLLTSLNLSNCKSLDFPATVESMAGLKNLQHLIIGGDSLSKIPFNIFKLRSLSTLDIRNSCLTYFPTSFKRLGISSLVLDHCSLTNDARFFKNAAGNKSLKSLSIANLVCQNIDLSQFDQLDSLDIRNCALTSLPLSLKNTGWINLSGNYFNRIIKFTSKRTLVGFENYRNSNPNKSFTHKESFVSTTPFRKTIYTHVGESFTHRGIQFDVPPSAFLNKQSQVIDGEVVLSINVITRPQDLALLDKNFKSNEDIVINPNTIVEIKAYQQLDSDQTKGADSQVKQQEKKKTQVYINQKNPINITVSTDKYNTIGSYRYAAPKKNWVPITANIENCVQSKEKPKTKSFKSTVYNNLAKYPTPSFKVRKSKVQIKLKRNKRRNTLKFEITPEYGYRENFFQLYGDKIKGYPELKVFKKVKWKYVGDSVAQVLEQLYFLSEQAKSEKLKKKSTFYFYVLDIKNITIVPHPEKDNYLMRIVQGKDTLQLDVLPNLTGMKAKKIQKWHNKKYKKYNRKLEERILYWNKLDSLHLNYFESFEKKLSKFRRKVLENEVAAASKPAQKEQNTRDLSFEVNKTGWYMIGDKLLITEVKETALKLKISDRTHHAKYVLVRNPKNDHTYWQPTKNVLLSGQGTNYIYTRAGTNVYAGTYKGNKIIELSKINPK